MMSFALIQLSEWDFLEPQNSDDADIANGHMHLGLHVGCERGKFRYCANTGPRPHIIVHCTSCGCRVAVGADYIRRRPDGKIDLKIGDFRRLAERSLDSAKQEAKLL